MCPRPLICERRHWKNDFLYSIGWIREKLINFFHKPSLDIGIKYKQRKRNVSLNSSWQTLQKGGLNFSYHPFNVRIKWKVLTTPPVGRLISLKVIMTWTSNDKILKVEYHKLNNEFKMVVYFVIKISRHGCQKPLMSVWLCNMGVVSIVLQPAIL